MKSTTKSIFILLLFAIPFLGSAQVITNVNTSSQNCQCDTVNVTFAVTAPLNAGNQFKVELSTSTGVFPGTYIEINPLLGFNIGAYNMDAIIPCTASQGLYKIRIVGSNPVIASDTLNNIIIGRNPNTNMTIFGTYTFGQTQRFCEGDTAYIVGPVPPLGETHQYSWFSNGAIIPGETDDSLMVTTSGVYSVKVTLGLCDAISKDTIINAYTPPAYILHMPSSSITMIGQDSIQMCEGTVATLQGPLAFQPGINFRYQWLSDSVDIFGAPYLYPLLNDTLQTLDIDSAGTFYLAVMETNGGCMDTSVVFHVFVDTIPATNIVNVKWAWQNIATLNLCLQDSAMLSAVDSVAHPDWKYQWQVSYPPGSPWLDIPNDTLPFLQVDQFLIADTADYRLVTTNLTCTSTSNMLTVRFINDPMFQFFPSDSVATCLGDSVLVQLVGNGLQYQWADGYLGANRWMSQAGSYPVKAVGVNSCFTWDTLKVGIFQVNANAGSDQTIAPGEYAQLNGSGGVSYFWFADKPVYFNNQFIANPLTQPTEDTTLYFVQVTGPNGCTDIDSVWVFVVDTAKNPYEFANVQNVITPNGDGKNDFLNIPELLQGDDCEVVVLNRWGAEVYRSNPYINSFNGNTTGGAELPDGTYYYIVKFKDVIRYKGPVTIIRNSK